MSETLRRLVNISPFPLLQEKLEAWLDSYHLNSTLQNADRCREAMELNARVQSQLAGLLRIVDPAAVPSSIPYPSSAAYPYSKYPWYPYYYGYPYNSYPYTTPATAELLLSQKNREINEIQDNYDANLQQVEDELNQSRIEADELKSELDETKADLDDQARKSTTDKMFTETEMSDLRAKLRSVRRQYEEEIHNVKNDLVMVNHYREVKEATDRLRNAEDEIVVLRSRSGMVEDYERTIRRLRDDISILTGRRDTLTVNGMSHTDSQLLMIQSDLDAIQSRHANTDFANDNGDNSSFQNGRCSRSGRSVTPRSQRARDDGEVDSLPLPYKPLPRPGSPFASDDVTQRVRQPNLIQRFNDMFSIDRLDAMDTLRRFSDDQENNHRILFTVMQEAFSAAKLSFANFKNRVRSNIAGTHVGPETLEEAVQNYINRNQDLYDLPGLVSDVVRGLNRSVRISLPADVSYTIIQPFIREACKLAWNMSSLAHTLDIAIATDGELFEDSKYRRSYDSEYTAPLVAYHVWPALKQGLNILMKGEASTRRGASIASTPRRSRSPMRSVSPSRARSVSPLRAISPVRSYSKMGGRSRSPSPSRRLLDSSLSGRASSPVMNGRRSMSPSRASSRAVTASTSLSHYGVAS